MAAPLSKSAVAIAARATALRPDQIESVLESYRAAVEAIEDEPEWQAISHMCGGRASVHQYRAEGTEIVLQIITSGAGTRSPQDRCYILAGASFETFAEARAIELEKAARPKPRVIEVE